ncbi:TPA: DNA breaking-rejoining protein [Escherichia coli]
MVSLTDWPTDRSICAAALATIPGETLAELNALSGPAVSLVVFSSGYRPRRGDRVVYDGQQWTVTRHERFNGKPMIFIE